MPRKKRRKAFWRNFKFKYKLTIVNENTLEEVVGLHVSKLNGLSVLITVLTVLFLIAASIIAFTPLRNYLPGYMNSEVRKQIVSNALRVDSLQLLLERQNLYIMNIQDIFSGKVQIDSVRTLDSLTAARKDTLMERTRREEEFRRQYEESEKYNLSTIISQPDVSKMILYRPVRGWYPLIRAGKKTFRNRYCGQSEREYIGCDGRNGGVEHVYRRNGLCDYVTA